MFEIRDSIEVAEKTFNETRLEAIQNEDSLKREFDKILNLWEGISQIGKLNAKIFGNYAVGYLKKDFVNKVFVIQESKKILFWRTKVKTILELEYKTNITLDYEPCKRTTKINYYNPDKNPIYMYLFNEMQDFYETLLNHKISEMDKTNAFHELSFN